MRKLILSSVVLTAIGSNVFALTCPEQDHIVDGSQWTVPAGWMVYSESKSPAGLLPMIEVRATAYGDVKCKYKSIDGWLEIQDTAHVNTILNFDGRWSSANQFHFICLTDLDNLNSCSYNM